MTRHPVDGIKGSKPRLPGAGGNGKVSKAELGALNREYLNSRNRTQAAKAETAEMELERRRGELISKRLAFAQLSYLLVVFRQRTLLAPGAITRRLVSLGFVEAALEHSVSQAIKEDVHALLTELAHLPEKVTDENWLKTLEAQEEEAAAERQQTPGEIKVEQARAKVRRQKKTAVMRRLRSEGRAEGKTSD